jgi:hypothetical protein
MRLAMMIVATGPVLSPAQKTQIQSEEHDRERWESLRSIQKIEKRGRCILLREREQRETSHQGALSFWCGGGEVDDKRKK